MHRYPAIDAVRAGAAFLVLVSHVGFWTGYTQEPNTLSALVARGDVGVAIFFAVSAFLLSEPWLRHLATGAPAPSVAVYLTRRLVRIFPAYWVALGAVLLITWWVDPAELLGTRILAHLVLLQGLVGGTFVGFSQTWSLTTEFTFYLALPVAATWWVRRATRGGAHTVRGRHLLAAGVTVGVLISGLASRWDSAVLGRSMLGHLAWFCVGVLVAVVRTHATAPRFAGGRVGRALLAQPQAWLMVAVAAWAVAATPAAGPYGLEATTPAAAMTKELLYTVVAGAVVLAATGPAAPWTTRDWTRVAGDTSYGVFLWHLPVLQALFAALDLDLWSEPFVPVLILVLLVTAPLATASHLFLERPLSDWVHRRGQPARTRAG